MLRPRAVGVLLVSALCVAVRPCDAEQRGVQQPEFRQFPAPTTDGRGEVPRADLALIRRQVLATLALESRAEGFAERRQAVADLVELHEQLAVDPRVGENPVLQSLARRVAGRLRLVSSTLAAEFPRGDLTTAEPTARGGRGAGGHEAEAQSLIDLIQSTVRPEAWEPNGGRARMSYFANGHGLVVLAPEDVHEDVGGLIRQLR